MFYLIFLVFFLSSTSITGTTEPWWEICNTSSNYTSNSTYESNLNTLLTTLTTNGSISGYSNSTYGQIPNQVFGLVLCRGDIAVSECLTCLESANHDARQLCPYNKGAVIWYDNCVLLYSQLILSSTDNTDQQILLNVYNVTDVARFNYMLNELMNKIADWAAYNTSKKFATGEISRYTDKVPTIYGLVQCTPDMGANQCRQCLKQLLDQIQTTELYGKQGGRVLGVRCTMRFESATFFEGDSMIKLTASVTPATAPEAERPIGVAPPPVDVPADGSARKKSSIGVVIAITLPLAATALLLVSVCTCFFMRKSAAKPQHYENESNKDDISSAESILYTSSTIRTATSNFAEVNKLGQGGFGVVYKGLLPDGRVIAIKKLLTSSNQGLVELKNELVLVAKLQHRNLVRLLGVCLQEEKLLVYEYVPNGGLDTFLFDPIRRLSLPWRTRYKIICGIARGLQYLHEESQLKIVHRDLKASNILLDANMNPKITDFGIAKLFGDDQTQGNTNCIVGTFGYMAPEYVMHGLFSIKSDVYSFGILVLEIVTGRKNNGSSQSEHHEDLLSYTWEKWSNGSISEVVDQTLGNEVPSSEVLKCIHIGLLCVQENPADRPNMSTVNVMLNSSTISLQAPSKPPFIFGMRAVVQEQITRDSNDSRGSKHDGSPAKLLSKNDFTATELEPR